MLGEVLDATEAARVSDAARRLLTVALEEHAGAASSADLSALTPRGAMLASALRCAAGRAALGTANRFNSTETGLPLLGPDALVLLQTATRSLKGTADTI